MCIIDVINGALDPTEKNKIENMFAGDSNRDASPKIRGFLFQDLVAVDKLLAAQTVSVYLECLEDVDVLCDNNELIAFTKVSSNAIKQFTYDRQGGIVEERNPIGIWYFFYSSYHQQTRVEAGKSSIQENCYDAENLRFELLENGRKISYVCHNGKLLYEEGREGQKTSRHLGLRIDILQREQALSYYHRDEQLSMTFITDSQGGIRNSYQYDAFGAELEFMEQFSNRIRYTGQQYNELSEQYYLRVRYYDSMVYYDLSG